MRFSLYYDVGCLGAPLVHFRRHKSTESYRIEGTIAEIEQELLAKRLVLADHGHRVPDADKLRKQMVTGISRAELFRARTAFSESKFSEGWSHLCFGMKLDPASWWRPEFAGTLARLIVGPRARRWLKSALSKPKA
jgi:hypothetical protein